MPDHADFLLIHAHLLTLQGPGVGYLKDGAVAVQGDRIAAVGPTEDLLQRFTADEVLDSTGYAVLPGLVDAHLHSPESLLRGVAQDVSHWMQLALDPYLRHVGPEEALAGVRLSVLEGLKAGTTTFGDYTLPIPGWPEFYEHLGVRARLTPKINALPATGMAGLKVGDLYPFDEARGRAMLDAAVAFARTWHGAAGGRITVMLGPQAPDMLSRELLLEVKRAAEREGLMINMHVAQGDREVDQRCKRYGKRTQAYLDELGYLDSQLLAVHLTEATDEETALIARRGAHMVLCSGSIGIIDGIVPPAHVFRQAGGLVALGTDQASGNNCLNLFNEMKLTALFNKVKYRDPTVMPAWEVLRMATIEGAQAIGLGDAIGSLAPGKQADMIWVDLSALNLSPVLEEPVRNLVPNLVYAASGHEVTHVMVAGRMVMRDRRILTVDEEEVRGEAQRRAQEVARRVAADPEARNLALLRPMAAGYL